MSSIEVSDIKAAYYSGDLKETINLIKSRAEEGNAAAADVYGDLLMTGVWDTRQMEIDLILRDRLAPNETYLLLPRDPLKAIEIYKLAAESATEESAAVKLDAQTKIDYCKSKGLAGFKKDKPSDNPKINRNIAEFLDTNARNYRNSPDLESNDFVALPDTRPDTKNPLKKMFKRMGLKFRNRCITQIVIAQIVALLAYFYSYWSNAVLLSLSVLVSISVPIGIFAYIAHYQGYKRGLPLCSCTKISNAYDLSIKSLPAECKPAKSPFETTQPYIRYTQAIKGLFFWIYVLVSLIRVIQILINFKGSLSWLSRLADSDPKGLLFFTVPVNYLILSLFIVFWDKGYLSFSNVSGLFGHHEEGSAALIYFLISVLVSILAHDKDCDKESERVKQKSHLENLIDKL
jgi:hypothetical protein